MGQSNRRGPKVMKAAMKSAKVQAKPKVLTAQNLQAAIANKQYADTIKKITDYIHNKLILPLVYSICSSQVCFWRRPRLTCQ